MTEQRPESAAPDRSHQRFQLTPQPPVRALAIAAATVLAGAVVVVLGSFRHWSGWLIGLGSVVMLLGVALGVTAVIMTQRSRLTLLLDDGGVTLVRSGARRSLRWQDVTQVVQQGPRVVLATREGADELVLVRPPGSSELVFDRLLRELRTRLDRDRGYGQPG